MILQGKQVFPSEAQNKQQRGKGTVTYIKCNGIREEHVRTAKETRNVGVKLDKKRKTIPTGKKGRKNMEKPKQ